MNKPIGRAPAVQGQEHWTTKGEVRLFLWEKRTGDRLRGQLFTKQGGLAGILRGRVQSVGSGSALVRSPLKATAWRRACGEGGTLRT